MSVPWHKLVVDLPKDFNKQQLKATGELLIEMIRLRTEGGKDKRGKSFPAYSKAYKDSLDFKIAGKSNKVNLKLTGDMLASIKLLKIMDGKVQIGYDDKEENAKADGHITGNVGKKRDFFGLQKKEIAEAVRKIKPLKDKADLLKALAAIGSQDNTKDETNDNNR